MIFKRLSDEEAEFINKHLVTVESADNYWVMFEGKTKPKLTPIVKLDASERPDIADLRRVVSTEGMKRTKMPAIKYIASNDQKGMILTISLHDPVDCFFTVFLEWLKYRDFYTILLEQGVFYLTVNELEGNIMEKSFGIKVSQSELIEAIELWKRDYNCWDNAEII